MGNASMGWAAQFGAGASSPVTSQFEFLSCDIGKQTSLVETLGMRGSRAHNKEGVTDGTYIVGGTVLMEPRPDDLDFWLYYIMGGAKTGNNFALTETLPELYTCVDCVAKVYEQAGMKVNAARFRSGRQTPTLQMELDLQGKTETEGNAGSFPAISASLSVLQPYCHFQSVLTIGSTAYEIDNVELSVSHALVQDRFFNSQSRTELPPGDLLVTLSCDNPFTSSEVAIHNLALAGAAATLVYTNATRSLTFTLANLKKPRRAPALGGRNTEIPLRCEFQAFMSGATRELVVANDSTA